jgi:hypothetical protein
VSGPQLSRVELDAASGQFGLVLPTRNPLIHELGCRRGSFDACREIVTWISTALQHGTCAPASRVSASMATSVLARSSTSSMATDAIAPRPQALRGGVQVRRWYGVPATRLRTVLGGPRAAIFAPCLRAVRSCQGAAVLTTLGAAELSTCSPPMTTTPIALVCSLGAEPGRPRLAYLTEQASFSFVACLLPAKMGSVIAFIAGLLAATTTAAAAPPPVDALSWLPASTQSVTGAPGAGVSLLKWLRDTVQQYADTLGTEFPACWSSVTAPIVASYQIWGGGSDEEAAVLAQGQIDRAALEKCIDRTLRMGSSPRPRISRLGHITMVNAKGLGRMYIGWTPSWIVWHSHRARVRELLAATNRKKSTISPALESALRRVDRQASLWFGTTLDYSKLFLGVASLSVGGSVDTAASPPTAGATFEYASTDDAKRAADAVTTAGGAAALAPELRAVARDARPIVKDRFLELKLDGQAIVNERAMAAFEAWLDQKRHELAGP